MFYFYILRCADGTLYSGASKNLEKRVATHNAGKGAKYTRARLPVEVVYFETFKTFGKALQREAAVKRLSRAQKEALICAWEK